MSTESTEAYLRAIDILRSIGRDEIDIEQRWYVETLMVAARRRSAARRRAAR